MRTKPIIKTGSELRLFIAFAALESFRYCLLRMSEWSLDYSALPVFSQPLVLPYYFAMFTGVVSAVLLIKRFKIFTSAVFFRTILVLSAVSAMVSLHTSGFPKLILMFFSFFIGSVLICICMRGIAIRVNFAVLCRFIAFSFAAYHVAGGLCLFLRNAHSAYQTSALAFFALAAVLSWTGKAEGKAEQEAEIKLEPFPPKRIVSWFTVVLCLYGFIAGVLYNIFFIKEGTGSDQSLYFLTMMCCGAIYIIIGLLLDKVKWHNILMLLFLLVIIGQTLSFFFSHESVIALPFSYISLGGFIALDAVTIILPLYYMKKRKKYNLAGVGYAFLYGGLFITTFMLKFVSEDLYRGVSAAMLVTSPIAMLICFVISSEYTKTQVAPIAPPEIPLEEMVAGYGFTGREIDVLRLLIDGQDTDEIAGKLFINSNTVNKYISSMITKAAVKSRIKLIMMFSGHKD